MGRRGARSLPSGATTTTMTTTTTTTTATAARTTTTALALLALASAFAFALTSSSSPPIEGGRAQLRLRGALARTARPQEIIGPRQRLLRSSSSSCFSSSPASLNPLRTTRRRPGLLAAHAKRKKGPRPDGSNGNSKGPSYKTNSPVSQGDAYRQETREIILSLDRVSKTAPSGKKLLSGVSLGMYLGAKIGILGANGAGKSTLLKILAGVDTAIEGEIHRNKGIRVGYLEQEPSLSDGETVKENLAAGMASTKALLDEFNEVSAKLGEPDADTDALMRRMDRLQTEIDACNGWEIDRVLEQAADALRCPPGDAPVATLSGGERRRVALAKLLVSAPDILLLDEPTNHLDAESVAWLEQFLKAYKGTVVAVTHDRYFLDACAGWILELDQGKGIPFEGNYNQWLEAKAGRLEQEGKQKQAREKALAKELEWVRKQQKGQQKKGKARMRRYEELLAESEAEQSRAVLDGITIPPGPRLGGVVLEVDGLAKGFGERLLYEGLSFAVPPGATVGIIGGNGVGKTTLFKMVTGVDNPDQGSIRLGETVRPVYVDQGRDELDPDKSVFEQVGDGYDELDLGGRKVNTRAYLSWYNFRGADQSKKVGDLSGGERNRLMLARALRAGGNLLMLDEPTNDLDVETLRCLEDAIEAFPGSTLVVSHDRWFLDRIATHILAFEGDSKATFFEGSYSEYDADRRKRLGSSAMPTRVKFRKLANM